MKKMMIRFFLPALAALLLCAGASAQQLDTRQCTTETIVADGLAQLPAATVATFDQVMGDFAALGREGVEAIAAMLVPASEGKNATFEYALSGVAVYVTGPGHEALREGVRKGFVAAIEACSDDANRAFLLSQLQLCSTAEDAPVLVGYLSDRYLNDYALRALISTPGTEQALLKLAENKDLESETKRALAYAFGRKRMTQAEPILLEWFRNADAWTAEPTANALSECGSRASVKPLAEAAAKVNYAWEPAGVTDAYLKLLSNLAASDPQIAAKAAKGLLKCEPMHIRGAGLTILAKAQGLDKTMSHLRAAVKQGPAEYRFAALTALGKGDEKTFALLADALPGYTAEARAAVIAWLGDCGAKSQSEVITKAVASTDGREAKAAIAASARIGGQQALTVLITALDSPYAEQAMTALKSFNGDISSEVVRLLASDDSKKQVSGLKLAALRRMTQTADRVFALLNASDETVCMAAYEALPAVSGPQHADRLAQLLDVADAKYVSSIQTALSRTVATLPVAAQYDAIAKYMQSSKTPARYYPVLAKAGTPEAVACLAQSFREGDCEAAFAALLTVDAPGLADILYGIASENRELADEALMRYAALSEVRSATPMRRYELCRRALELNPSYAVMNKQLDNLAEVRTLPALILTSRYMGHPATAEMAASAVRTIVAKSNPMPGGESVRQMLEKAREVYRSLPDADSGYAIDEIDELLRKIPAVGIDGEPTPPFKLCAEEDAEGYEVLFDGVSLDKWTGNKTNYVPLDGTIDVTASYGGSGNLYTIKEYADFNLRFEFRFLCEGVNNGIGIRTPMGVDAAYEGMEIQVLDHDAPIYKNLRVYQQHGSVYGIMPAQERVKFGEMGTWNTMEIAARGDKIRVTVNGRVILDGNIREACKGHHVAPEGEKKNPYTVDGKNHPGLFNTKGHIGLLGHGSGIQYRNMRILELSKRAKNK